MMEFAGIGVCAFIIGVVFGVALTQRSIKIEAAGVKIEARSVREIKGIMEAFDKSDPFAKVRGPVQ